MLYILLIIFLPVIMFFGYLYIQKLDVKFNQKADLLEQKIISGYNMVFAAEEFKRLKRIALNRKNQERVYQLRRLFLAMYGHFIK